MESRGCPMATYESSIYNGDKTDFRAKFSGVGMTFRFLITI